MTTQLPHPDRVPRLRVESLTVTFGGLTAVNRVSFEVYPGEIVALIGPNGAGKTTVFNAICALVRRRGVILIDGKPAPSRPSALTAVGVSRTLQGLGLFPSLTVRENMTVPVARHPARASEIERRLSALQLEAFADMPVAALPYPERKRVALARALVTSPTLLLLDEPAGGLGGEDIADLAQHARALASAGTAVLVVEHHVDFVMGLADRIVVLDFGEMIAHGRPDEVRRNPRVEEAYLGVRAAS